jgi:hypothetical protein
MQMNKIGAFLDIFITSKNRREALERAHVHAEAAGLWATMSPEEQEEFTFFCYYLWMIAADKRKEQQKRQNPLKLHFSGEDERPDSKYHPGELTLGIQVEMEHTDDLSIAKKIAKDHLDEIPNYYSLLVLMEKIHHDRTGQFFGDYFDAMGNKLQVLVMQVQRAKCGDGVDGALEKVIDIYKKFKQDVLPAEKEMRSTMVQNPLKDHNPLVIQSVVIPREWGVKKSRAWLKAHGLKNSDMDAKENTLRFRQHSPGLFKSYFSKKFSNGVVLVLGVLKKKTKGTYTVVSRGMLSRKTPPRSFSHLTLF